MKTLFGDNLSNNVQKSIVVNLYCDEIKKVGSSNSNDKWVYVGVLIVPKLVEDDLISDLLKARYSKDSIVNNDYKLLDTHDDFYLKNNRIVHFSELSADTYYIAHRWYQYIKSLKSVNKIYFNVLGINCGNLCSSSFGGKQTFLKIYDRFFRTAVAYPLLKYFPNQQISIENIFHEIGEQQQDNLFPWHTIYKINDNKGWPIECLNEKIQFLGKDHTKDKRANFIQLIDIILGSTRNSFDNATKNKFKIKLTDDFIGLVQRLIEKPDNPKSNYCPDYCHRMNIDFFPKYKLNPKDSYYQYQKITKQFYKQRAMSFCYRNQTKLF